MGRGQELLNLVKSIKQERELQTVQEEIKEVIKPENLKAGVTAFGVEGNKNIVDTQSANLNGYYLKPGYTGYAKGEKISGSANLFNSSNPTNLYGTQTIINPESPNFILTHQHSDGTMKGKIITIPNNVIPSEYIEGKNICIRAGRWGEYYRQQWRIEIAVCDWGNQFFFKNSGGAMCLICKGPSGNPPYVLYTQNVDELSQLTSTNWTKKEVASSNYMTEGLGRYPETYCYSRDNSWPAGSGLTRSSGVPGSIDKIYIKNVVGANTTTGFVDSNANIYNVISQSTIANAINLMPEHIKKGETYLGVEGTMLNNNAMIKTSVAQQGSSSQILHCIEYLPDDLYVDSSTAQYLFAYMSSLKALPKNLNLSKVTQANYMCFRCYALEGNIKINVNNLTSVMNMFADCKLITSVEYFPTTANMFTELFDGCINLIEIPELNTANAAWSGMINPFRNCPKLSDNSLNNILAMCTKATAIAEAKTYANLKSTGLSQEQAAKCQTLSNWDAFVAAGWTTGYTELDIVTEE